MTRAVRLGIFVLAVMISFAAAAFLVGKKQFLFANTYRLRANFDTVMGLEDGAAVRLGGVRVGTVSSIQMPARLGSEVTVNLILDGSTIHLVRRDSVASIETEGLLGSKFVSISFGSPGAPSVHNEDVIKGAPPVDLTAIVDKTDRLLVTADSTLRSLYAISVNLRDITAKVNSGKGTLGALVNDKQIYNEVNEILDRADDTLKSAEEAAVNAKDVTAKINTGAGTLGALINDRTLYRNLNATAENAAAISRAAKDRVSSILQRTDQVLSTADATLKNIDAATANARSITSKINLGQGTLGALINDKALYADLSKTMANIDATAVETKAGATAFSEDMEALKHNWFLRGYFNNRGYENASDRSEYLIPQIPKRPWSKAFLVGAGDIFPNPDSAKLKNQDRIRPIGQYLQDHPFNLAIVVGYTDMKGDSAQDLKLSEARAYVIRKYIVDNFKLLDTRIKTKGLGKQEPIENRPANGIEVLIYQGSASPSGQPSLPAPGAPK